MGMLTDGDKQLLRNAQQSAENRLKSYLDQLMKFTEFDTVKSILEQMQQWGNREAYVYGVSVRSMSARIDAYRRAHGPIAASVEHAYRGCLIVLHATAEDARREQRYERREWEAIQDARRMRLARQAGKTT